MSNTGADQCNDRLSDAVILGALFDECDQVCMFIKDHKHRFAKCNRALLRIHGLNEEKQMLGKTDHDFHPPLLADAYVAEDRQIINSKKPVRQAIWLVMSQAGSRWFSSTKLPVLNKRGAAIGVAGVMQPFEGRGELPVAFDHMKAALTLADQGYAQGIKVSDMAAEVGLSTSQFTRNFRVLFHMSPGEYLLRLKLDHACRGLVQSSVAITEIALEAGFYDHSAFTKAFRKHYGITPKQYRSQFGKV